MKSNFKHWLTAVSAVVALTIAAIALAVTVDTSTRTVTSKNFIIQWSLIDQEAITSVQWDPGGDPASVSNLTASFALGECDTAHGRGVVTYWGNSWDPQVALPLPLGMALVGPGTTTPRGETAWAPKFGGKGVEINSESTNCSPPSAMVPVKTRYRFFDQGLEANVIRLDREFDFEEQPFSTAFRPYMPRLSLDLGFSEVKYPTTSGTLATVSALNCGDGCTEPVIPSGPSLLSPGWDPTRGWFAIHDSATATGVIVRRAPNGITPQLWVDYDAQGIPY